MAPADIALLIGIASASQQVINASAAYDRNRNDKNVRRSHIRLGGELQRIIAASQTLLNEALRTGHSSSTSRNPAVHTRLSTWLSSDEPQECLGSLHIMEKLITSSSGSMGSPFLNPFRMVSPKDTIKDALQVLEKHKDCFYFLLATDVWNQTVNKDASRPAPVKPLIGGAAFVKEGANCAEWDLVNSGWNAIPTKLQPRFTINEAQLNELLEWLAAWNCKSKHEETLDLRQPNTCTWLTDTFEYMEWRNTDNSFLWLNGKPGSGKSVLAASVIDGIKKTLDEGELLVYFYCDFRSERSTASSEVMRSLLSQLLRGFGNFGVDPGDILSDLDRERREQGSILINAKRLSTFVSRAAKQFARQPLMVIDALDECNDIENLLKVLDPLTKKGIRLFVVSRPLQIIKDSFRNLETISLESMFWEVAADIRLHVAKEVDSHRRLRIVDPALKEEISQTLCKKADGMFRWVECQLITLKRCITAMDIRKALQSLPIGLETTYEQIFLAMNQDDMQGIPARRVLVWLVAALDQLRLCEIVEALAIDIDRRVLNRDVAPVHGPALLDTLGSLVTHDEKTDIVILSHFSVKTYLTTKYSYCIDERDAHVQLARQCMSYIGACLKRDNEISNDSYPLLKYALSSGFRHLGHAYPNYVILNAIVALDKDIRQHPLLASRMLDSRCLPRIQHDPVLYILVRYASEELLRLFLGHFRPQLKEGTNPLNYVTPGKTNHARILLSFGAKLNHPGRFVNLVFGSTTGLPIEAAVRDENRELVDLFIAEGSPVPRRLFSAVIKGKDIWSFSKVGVARLVQTDEFMEWVTAVGDKALPLRALRRVPARDVLGTARRLKQIGCDFADCDLPFDNLLRQAVRTGHVSTIEYFFSKLKVPLPPDILFSLPLDCCPAPAIRCLLLNGADIHFLSPDDSTVLHHFIEGCKNEDNCLEGTKVLLEAGSDPSACNLKGEAPIHIATQHGFISVIKHLLSFPPLPPDILFSFSSRKGLKVPPPKVIRSLIAEAADPNAVAPDGSTLLHRALESRTKFHDDDCLEIIRIFIEAGCDPRVPDSLGKTPLDFAVANSLRGLPVEQYLRSVLNVSLPYNLLQPGTSPLSDDLLTDNVLPAGGTDARITSSDKHKELHKVLTAGNRWDDGRCRQVAKILEDSGCPQPYTCDCAGQTLFDIIVEHRCSKILKSLLSSGVPPPSNILLALQYRDKDLGMIQLLLKNGADARATSFYFKHTPLHRAIYSAGSERLALQFTEILIDAGGDPCAANSRKETPMHTAVKYGYLTVVKHLLLHHVPLPPNILLTASGCDRDNTSIIRFLIENGAVVSTVTRDCNNALHLALGALYFERSRDQATRLETAKILVEAGCDIHAKNKGGKTPLFFAAQGGCITIVEYLLSQGATLPNHILFAIASGGPCFMETSIIQSLVRMGLNSTHVHAITSDGDTILHRAAIADSPDFAKRFVEMGCNPLLCNLVGETPLQIAVRWGKISVVRYFLSIGVPLPSDVLHSAVSGTRGLFPNEIHISFYAAQMIRLLVREGADVNAINNNGDTPLHVLLQHNFGSRFDSKNEWETTQVLLNSGCSPHTRNRNGQTPVDLAEAKGPFFLQNFMRLARDAQNISIPKPKLCGRRYIYC